MAEVVMLQKKKKKEKSTLSQSLLCCVSRSMKVNSIDDVSVPVQEMRLHNL